MKANGKQTAAKLAISKTGVHLMVWEVTKFSTF